MLKTSKKPKVAIVRGKFLNKYEMQSFEPLTAEFELVGFSSFAPLHNKFTFPIIKLPSPADLPNFPYKMPILNRLFVDAHYLFGLEEKLKGFDIAHTAETYFHYTNQCLNAKKKGYVKKVVATVWENVPFNNEGIWGRKGFKKKAIRELDHIIAVTKRAKESLILEGTNPGKITIINPGIDIEKFSPNKKRSKKDNINILFVGRLEREKGVFELVYALGNLFKDKKLKKYKLRAAFIGKGPEKNKLLNLERRLGINKFITHKVVSYRNIADEYRQADIFVAPSKTTPFWQEQYGMALLEAQASGLAIVTTKSGSIFENVSNVGLYAKEGDFLSLARQIEKFVVSPSLRINYEKKARIRAINFHDVKIKARQISNLYKKLLKT